MKEIKTLHFQRRYTDFLSNPPPQSCGLITKENKITKSPLTLLCRASEKTRRLRPIPVTLTKSRTFDPNQALLPQFI